MTVSLLFNIIPVFFPVKQEVQKLGNDYPESHVQFASRIEIFHLIVENSSRRYLLKEAKILGNGISFNKPNHACLYEQQKCAKQKTKGYFL